ncbi:hypothetical protein TorRG33x02_152930 [Trema orientale]|uniref:RNase H type-1 domain-containing protein n=1 Tax=Trema orientale TaxID=63057 RepID=A0A2P5ETN4_TREOI|nr:hypothetical protein TorRG33x02_152930 [Trema orientale]
MDHALFNCHIARQVWRHYGFWKQLKIQILEDLGETLLNVDQNISIEDFEKCCILFWCIWLDRNHHLHGGASRPVESIVAFANSFLDEYHAATDILGIHTKLTLSGVPKWMPPSLSIIKLNSDASIRTDRDHVGIGVVFRDHLGLVLAACTRRLSRKFLVEVAELLAIRTSFLLAWDGKSLCP